MLAVGWPSAPRETEAQKQGGLGNPNPRPVLPAPLPQIPTCSACEHSCCARGNKVSPVQPPLWPLYYRESFQASNQIILLREAQH